MSKANNKKIFTHRLSKKQKKKRKLQQQMAETLEVDDEITQQVRNICDNDIALILLVFIFQSLLHSF